MTKKLSGSFRQENHKGSRPEDFISSRLNQLAA